VLNYNEHKVSQKDTGILWAKNFLKDAKNLSFSDKIRWFEKFTSLNERAMTNFASGSLFSDTLYRSVYKGNAILYQRFCYYWTQETFFSHAVTSKKVTKARRYNKRKKYLLFGSHYYKRRWYLKRRS
jgi:hypothetical protein